MADEIKISASLSVQKGGVWDGLAVEDFLVTFTGTKLLHNIQAVGTLEEAIQLGDVAAGGWMFLRNLGPTNLVALRASAGQVPIATLNAGEPCGPFRLNAIAVPTLAAAVAPVNVEVLVLEP